ncbi:hypothetical protein EXW59_00140 (plasmid) [Bacillus mycoides]|uniref:hypothetical protein n=1 Tax=Bacillus mycoides TaxID=1405 RepID=UPI001C02AE95|nr:hypothetical protein [Bacillus mycoides]QWH75361.1 hypothetical protein EXW59_00140 [Bacillus mycoides]
MVRAIISFATSIIILIVWSDWVFAKVPGSREAWEWAKGKTIEVYQAYGWEGVLLLGLVCIGLVNIVGKK